MPLKGQIIFTLFLLCLFSCNSYEKEYYEKISGIKFPTSVSLIESFDNGEYVTTSSFKVDNIELNSFIEDYNFQKVSIQDLPAFMGEHYLKKVKPDFNNPKDLYFKYDSKNENSWFYIVDLKKNVLWAEIQYPDPGGT